MPLWAPAPPCPLPLRVERMDKTAGHIMIDGNTAAGLGAVYAGATVGPWYPITPSTSLMDAFKSFCSKLRVDPETGASRYAVIQAEDELAAIGMVLGAIIALQRIPDVTKRKPLAAALFDRLHLLVQAFQMTMRITSMVAFILVGATCFSITFAGVDGNLWVEHWLTSLPGGVWGFLVAVNLFVFFIAFFLDFFEIAFIIVPMLAPVAQKLLAPVVGADAALIWFGSMLCVNLQTSFMHPPTS